MATRVSPIVNIQEIDLSYLPQAIAQIPYMYVGQFEKGQAFVPKYFDTYEDYEAEYGRPSSDFKIGYGVQSRMDNGGNVAVVRVLGQSGYVPKNGYALTADGNIVGYIRSNESLSIQSGGVLSAFDLGVSVGVSSTSGYFTNLSLLSTDSQNYIKNIISSTPNSPTTKSNNFTLKTLNSNAEIYVERLYNWDVNVITGGSAVGLVALTASNSYIDSYSNSKTPTIVSQPVNGQVYDLFKINTISDGKSSVKYKVGFSNINDKSGTFSLFVRQWNDTDKSPVYLETWNNLSLNPESDRFIGKVIGNSTYSFSSDGFIMEDGDYPNKSKYIYLTNVNEVLPESVTAVPGGFKGYIGYGDSALGLYECEIPLKRNQYNSSNQVLNSIFPGVDFTKSGIFDFLPKKPVNMVAGSDTVYKGFLLYDGIENTSLSAEFYGMSNASYGSGTYGSMTYSPSTTASYISNNSVLAGDKFILALEGGFDGLNDEVTVDQKLDFDNKLDGSALIPTSSEVESVGYLDFKKAIDVISSPDYVDYKLLFTTGVTNRTAIQYAFSMVENRADVFYVPDMVSVTADESELKSETELYDTSYGAVYYPSVKKRDISTGKYLWYDTSIILSEIFAYNDRIAYPWFAAAGFNRGIVKDAYKAYKPLSKPLRDDLYSNRINPIATFNSQGLNNVVVWGNRTLQKADSALSDVNIRRLIIEARKFVSSVATRILFDPIDLNSFDAFKRTTNPYFETIKSLRGLKEFKVVMDSSTTTPDDEDANRINGRIIIKPTKAAEEININFAITRQEANFDEL